MATPDIIKTSKSPDTNIMKMGHTTNRKFGSNPNATTKGPRPTVDIPNPAAKR